MKPPIKFKWKGIHHSYLGSWFIAFGAFFLYMNSVNTWGFLNYIYILFIIAGIYLVIDDIVEHTITESTPMRILWFKIILRE